MAFSFLTFVFSEAPYFLLFSLHGLKVADVMCFYSETGGFLPNRVGTLEEVVRLHLKVPSSQLLTLQMKSKLAEVKNTFSPEVLSLAV